MKKMGYPTSTSDEPRYYCMHKDQVAQAVKDNIYEGKVDSHSGITMKGYCANAIQLATALSSAILLVAAY